MVSHVRRMSCAVSLLPILIGGCNSSGDLQNPSPPEPSESRPEIDLAAGPIDAPGALRLDSLLELRVGVRNSGVRGAGPGWTVRVYLSANSVIDPSDMQIDQFVTTRELPAGGTDRYLRHKKLNGRIPPGRYFVGSILDVTNLVPEADETNNTLLSPASILLTARVPSASE